MESKFVPIFGNKCGVCHAKATFLDPLLAIMAQSNDSCSYTIQIQKDWNFSSQQENDQRFRSWSKCHYRQYRQCVCCFNFCNFSSSDFVSEVVLWDSWEMLQLQLPVAISLPLIFVLDNIVYFSFYMFAAQQDAVNEAQTTMKRLPATCAIQALQSG